jgi:hypothetical protein
MRKLVAVAAVLFLLASMAAGPATASSSNTFTTNITVGAGHTLPNGAWGFTDGCRAGWDGTTEYRCAFEFDISSLLSSAEVLTATLGITRTGGCATNDCPVDIFTYTGNGSDDLADVVGGAAVATWTPTNNSPHFWNVLGQVQARVTNGDDWIGFRISRNSGSARNPDWQDFDISSGNRVSLALTWVQRPVGVQVHLGGLGDGTVTSNPAGIDCGTTCLWWFEWLEPMTLTASPENGGTFDHWDGGECDGSTNPVCSFDVPATTVDTTAFFNPIGPPISQPPTAKPSATVFLTPPPNSTPKPTNRPSSGATAAPGDSAGPSAGATADASTSAPSADPLGSASPAPATTDGSTAGGSAAPSLAPGQTEPPDAPAAGDAGSALVPIMALIIVILALALGFVLYRGRRASTTGAGSAR